MCAFGRNESTSAAQRALKTDFKMKGGAAVRVKNNLFDRLRNTFEKDGAVTLKTDGFPKADTSTNVSPLLNNMENS